MEVTPGTGTRARTLPLVTSMRHSSLSVLPTRELRSGESLMWARSGTLCRLSSSFPDARSQYEMRPVMRYVIRIFSLFEKVAKPTIPPSV